MGNDNYSGRWKISGEGSLTGTSTPLEWSLTAERVPGRGSLTSLSDHSWGDDSSDTLARDRGATAESEAGEGRGPSCR